MQLKRHEPARKAYGRERRLLTQAEASSLARLPVGNDRRDSREPTVHSGLMIAYSIGSYSIEIMPTHFTPYSIDNIDNSPFSSPNLFHDPSFFLISSFYKIDLTTDRRIVNNET